MFLIPHVPRLNFCRARVRTSKKNPNQSQHELESELRCSKLHCFFVVTVSSLLCDIAFVTLLRGPVRAVSMSPVNVTMLPVSLVWDATLMYVCMSSLNSSLFVVFEPFRCGPLLCATCLVNNTSIHAKAHRYPLQHG